MKRWRVAVPVFIVLFLLVAIPSVGSFATAADPVTSNKSPSKGPSIDRWAADGRCVVDCPPGAQQEGEPPCGDDDYYDSYNGGCNSTGWTLVEGDANGCATVCGKSCTYLYQGLEYRDTDWYTMTAAGGAVTASCTAEFPLQFVLIYGLDCLNLQYEVGTADPCQTVALGWNFNPGDEFWLWVGPSIFSGVPPESDYVMQVCGIGNPLGACCFGPVCAPLSQNECSAFGGEWFGDPSCQPNPCTPPDPGACCSDGICMIEIEEICIEIQGSWDGAPSCQPNPCPQDPIVGPACPPGGLDRFDDTHAAFLFDVPGPGLGPLPVVAHGPTSVLRRYRDFYGDGHCEIQTEIVELSLTGIYDPDECSGQQLPVTITLAPSMPTLGTITSSNNGAGDPDFPADSFFDVFVEINIEGVGVFSHTVAGLGNFLDNGDLWGDPPCILPTDPYRPPSNDHAHIPCPDEDPPTGCCVLPPEAGGGMFVTNQAICDELGGTYLGDGVSCPCPEIGACCFDEVCALLLEPECLAFGGVWMGAPSCQPNPCVPQMPGACCFGPECVILLEIECMQNQGSWDGAPDCVPNPCPQDPTIGPVCPPGGLDRFDDTHAAFLFDVPGPGLGPLPVVAHGPTSVLRRVRDFYGDGHCEIQTEIVELSLTGVYDPDECSGQQLPVTITLAPSMPTLGTITSSNNGAGDPDFPADSFFDVFVEIDIAGVGVFSHTVAGLGNLLDSGDLWGDPPCILPTDPYRPPSNDHAHIPCPEEDPPTGCCVLPPEAGGGMFVTNQVICEELGGTYLGDGTTCECPEIGACCFDEVCAMLSDTECSAFGGVWLGSPSCQPNPCEPLHPGACCLQGECLILPDEIICIEIGGNWDGAEHCQPNPCPEDPTIGPPCPPGGLDRFDDTHAAFLFDVPGPGPGPLPIVASGPTTVLRRWRDFFPDGHCEIQTEILELSLSGIYDPDECDGQQLPVTITLSQTDPTLGQITSNNNGMGDPDFPAESFFDVYVDIDIAGLGVFTHLVADLGTLLNNGDLWGDPPCVHPNDPYRPPSNDHAHIPCPDEDPPTGCCVLPPEAGGGMFVTNEVICNELGGTYLGDGVPCPCPEIGACCFDEICALLLEPGCLNLGGVWIGVPSCSPNPCVPLHPGACCLQGECLILPDEIICIQIGGNWDGAPACEPNPCPQGPEGPPCPPGGLDRFSDTKAAFIFDAPGDDVGPRAVIAHGPTKVLRRARSFDPGGPCTIETEILQLDLTGVFNPDCRAPQNQHPVTITLDPNSPTLGAIISSDDGAGNPSFPDDSFFDVFVTIDIDGVGTFPHTVAGLGTLLNNGDLWGDPPCVHPNDPYRPPSNDHAHIPCPDGDPPTGCCVMPPELGNAEFITNQVICELLGGTYLGDGVPCDCDPAAIEDPPAVARSFGITEIVPNPSTGDVRITYQLKVGAATRIDIFDASGRNVRSIPMGTRTMGEHVWVWDGRDDRGRSLPTGVFFLTLQSGDQRTTREVVLIR